MAVKTRPFTGAGVDEQHARADAAVVLSDEVASDDVLRQLSLFEDGDRQSVSDVNGRQD
jgi:hypothetical protein